MDAARRGEKGVDGLSQQGAREVSKISSREEEWRRGKWWMVRYGKRKIFVKLLRFPIHSGKFSHIYSICVGERERVISLRPLFFPTAHPSKMVGYRVEQYDG